LNRGIEVIVKQNPSQYLWSYNRFKKPAGSHERN
jgi:lauroyl/myristoyl acyltransferase